MAGSDPLLRSQPSPSSIASEGPLEDEEIELVTSRRQQSSFKRADRSPTRHQSVQFKAPIQGDGSDDSIHSVEGLHPNASRSERDLKAMKVLRPYLSEAYLHAWDHRKEPVTLEAIQFTLAGPHLGDHRFNLPIDIPFIFPEGATSSDSNVVFNPSLREVQALQNTELFCSSMKNYVSMNIASPSLAYTLYTNCLQQDDSNRDTVCYDMRTKQEQLNQPLPGAFSFWDWVTIEGDGDEGVIKIKPGEHNNGSMPLANLYIKGTDGDMRVARVVNTILLIMPDAEVDWLRREKMLPIYKSVIDWITRTPRKYSHKLIHTKDYNNESVNVTASLINPQHCLALIILFRAISATDDFPPFISIARSSWLLDKSVFRYNRYAVPPIMYNLPETQGWWLPIEIVPPACPFFDPRHSTYGSLFMSALPSLFGLPLLVEWVQVININTIVVLGDGNIPMELMSEVLELDQIEHWEKKTIHELIRTRVDLVDDLWTHMQNNDRILLIEVKMDYLYSSCLAGLCLREWFGLSPRSCANFIKMRNREVNVAAIQDFITSDAGGKKTSVFSSGRYHSNTIHIGDEFPNWSLTSSFEDDMRKDIEETSQRHITVREFDLLGGAIQEVIHGDG